jgi:hypothetical protein
MGVGEGWPLPDQIKAGVGVGEGWPSPIEIVRTPAGGRGPVVYLQGGGLHVVIRRPGGEGSNAPQIFPAFQAMG